MIHALIVTPYRRYEFEVPAEHSGGSMQQAYAWLEHRLYSSDHEGLIELPGRIIAIDGIDVKSIEVWEEAPQLPTAGLVNLANVSISDEGPGELVGELPYLGNRLQMQLVTYRLRGYFYALPHQINDTPALEVLDHAALGSLTELLLQREGVGGTVVLPPVQLGSVQEAGEYVMDYAEQATPPAHFSPHQKTARAYGGLWNEK